MIPARLVQTAVLALALAGSLAGCALFGSWDREVDSFVGTHIDGIVRSWGPPTLVTTPREGLREYEYDLGARNPGCVHWWEVDDRDVITGYRYEGDCRGPFDGRPT